ncbi:MAG: hypothetical protein ACK4ND_05920, partial [Cytophagaceae bacterium]
MKKIFLLSLLVLLFCCFSSNAQIQISIEEKSGGIVKACAQSANFSIRFFNNNSDVATEISRRIIFPDGIYVSWDLLNLSPEVELNRIAGNILDIKITTIESGADILLDYTLEASCSFPASDNLRPQISGIPDESDINSYEVLDIPGFDVQAGNNGSLLLDPGFEIVNGISSPNWAFSANTGTTFTRSYKLINNDSKSYNGYITFQNNLPATIRLLSCEITYLDGSNTIVIQDLPSLPVTGIYNKSFKINNLPRGEEIIITETVEVVSCLSDGGNSIIRFSLGCTPLDVCAQLAPELQIHTNKREGRPEFTITSPEALPICVFGNSYIRSVTFTNTGTAAAINPDVYHVYDYLNNPQSSSTVVPVESLKIVVNKITTGELHTFHGKDLELHVIPAAMVFSGLTVIVPLVVAGGL